MKITTLYDYIEKKNKKQIEKLNNIYNFLKIQKYLSKINIKKTKTKFINFISKEDYELYEKYKNNMTVKKYEKILKHFKKTKDKKELYINENLEKYTKNKLDDLIKLHTEKIKTNNLLNSNLNETFTIININKEIKKWWNWINTKIILNIINNKKTKKTILVKNIITYIILTVNIYLVTDNINKLIIRDIKNKEKKVIDNYEYDNINNCYKFVSENINDISEDKSKKQIYKFLVENRDLYDIDEDEDNIIFNKMEDETYSELNKCYKLFNNIDIILRKKYKNNNIKLDETLQKCIVDFNTKINELSLIMNKEDKEKLFKINLDSNNNLSLKDKYYLFMSDIFNMLHNTFDYYLKNKLEEDSICYNCINNKNNIIRKIYKK
jgi:hypothetical protein